MRSYKHEISSWGGIAKSISFLHRPERIADILNKESQPFAARGLGRSYGDASLNTGQNLFLMERLNRFLEFNPKTGILKAEAGVSIAELIKTFVPKGFFVPVTPGTKEVTLGGCFAADVHGKNHHQDGSFSDHVINIELITANGLSKTVSKNDELFRATAGGMGLTGIITEITLKLLPIETAKIKTVHTPYQDLEFLLQHLSNTKARYSVAWIDLLSKKFKSIAMDGDHLKKEHKSSVPNYVDPKTWTIPFYAPSFLLNRLNQTLFNKLYYHTQRLKKSSFISSIDAFFYPLDKIGHWNRLYGKRGFYQYQFVVPEKGSSSFFLKIFSYLQKKKCPVYLAVLKKFGKENSAFLSFPQKGYTLAMDIPGNVPDLFELLDSLDEMVIENGGRVYLAKDLHLKPSKFKVMYPELPLFEAIKKKVDPESLIQTDLSRRLGIG